MSYTYATVSATSTDTHTTNNTWEDVNSLSATINTTGLGTTTILCLCTLQAGVTTANWEYMLYRFDLDTSSQSEVYRKTRDGNPAGSEQYVLTFHTVFEGISEGSHTVKVQWHNSNTSNTTAIYNRRLTIIAFASGLVTATASADDTHTTLNTWEDVNSMSVSLTPAATSDVLVLYSCVAKPNSTNWEHFGFRINRDSDTELSEAPYKTRDANTSALDRTERHTFHMATVFESVTAAAHTFKAQWHDNNSGLDLVIAVRRITAIAIPCETAYASSADSHTSTNTYETVGSMSVTLTNPADVLVMMTDRIGGTSANNEQWRQRFLADSTTASETYTKYRTSNPANSELYVENIHAVFAGLSYANHTIVGRWHDNGSNLDVSIGTRRIVGLILTDGTPPGPAGMKTINDLALASVKTVNDLAIASVKVFEG